MLKPPRRYTEDDRADALAMLEVYRGDIALCARHLNVPAKVLAQWAQGEPAEAPSRVAPRDLKRPFPPDEIMEDLETEGLFLPAPDVAAWMFATFIMPGALLLNEGHGHLVNARIGVLWTNVGNKRQGRIVAGTAGIPHVQGDRWVKAMYEFQLRQWFGSVPDFLITVSAQIADQMSDASFCALCEHELYHCGQAVDDFGLPRFSRTTGEPIFTVRGHDVEEFVGVVQRYGPGAASAHVMDLVKAARGLPSVAEADIAAGCGTCLARVA
jgi:hypothetical protein